MIELPKPEVIQTDAISKDDIIRVRQNEGGVDILISDAALEDKRWFINVLAMLMLAYVRATGTTMRKFCEELGVAAYKVDKVVKKDTRQ